MGTRKAVLSPIKEMGPITAKSEPGMDFILSSCTEFEKLDLDPPQYTDLRLHPRANPPSTCERPSQILQQLINFISA